MVELAQNDVVFCTGGIAECSYLVLSGQFSYVKLAKQYPAGGHHWIGDYCLWTPWLYMGELLAREIGRLVALEAEAFCECVGALNNLQLEDLTDVKMDEDEEEEESNLTLESLSSVKFLRCCCRYRSSVATSRSSTPLNSVSPVNPGQYHEALQIRPGDQILAVNGVAGHWEEMLNVIQVHAGNPGDFLRLTVI
eukprot:g25657.t1